MSFNNGFIHLVYSLPRHLLNAYYIPDNYPGTGNVLGKKYTQFLLSRRSDTVEETENSKQK